MKYAENVTTKKGVSGGHSSNEFHKALSGQGVDVDDLIVSKTPHPTIKGIYEVKYQIPRKDSAGNIAKPVTYKVIDVPKTIYDSSISTDDIYSWGIDAMKSGTVKGNRVEGYAPNGLKFVGYLDENGVVKNFYPTLN